MSRLNRMDGAGRTISIALCAGAAAMALAAVSCIKQKDSLVIVGMTAEMTIPGPIQVRVSVGPVTQTFDLPAGLVAAMPTERGIYLDSKTTGSQVVNATTQGGAPCLIYTAMPQQTVVIGSAGETKTVSLTLVHSGTCGGNADSGAGGTGGATNNDAGGDRPGAGGGPGTGGSPGMGGGKGGTGAGGTGTGAGGTGAGGTGAGAGAGGAGGAVIVAPPSLSRCFEIHHTDIACNLTTGDGDNLVFSVAFSPDGKLLLTAGDDGRIRFWKVGTGSVAPTVDGRELTVSGQGYMAFSHNGQYLAAGDGSGRVTVWTLSAAPTIYAILNGHTSGVDSVAFSPDDTHLVSVGGDMQLIVWSMGTRTSVVTIPITGLPWEVQISPLATATALPLVVTQNDGSFVLMNALATPATKLATLVSTDNTWTAEGVAFSPDGRSLAIGSEDGSFSLWNGVSTNQPTRTTPDYIAPLPNGNYQAVKGAAFFPDGKHVAAATGTFDDGGQLAIFETTTKLQVGSKIPTYYFQSVAVSPDGGGIAAGEVDCGLVMYCHD